MSEPFCRFCKETKHRPFDVSLRMFYLMIVGTSVGVVATPGNVLPARVLFSLFTLIILVPYIKRNVIGYLVGIFKDPLESEGLLHTHVRLPEKVAGQYRDHRDRVIPGWILIIPQSGWSHRPYVLGDSIYDGEWTPIWADKDTVRLRDRLYKEVLCSPDEAIQLINENVSWTTHVSRSRSHEQVIRFMVKAQDQAAKSELKCGTLGLGLIAVERFLTNFPKNSQTAQKGRELIGFLLEEFDREHPGLVSQWRENAHQHLDELEWGLAQRKTRVENAQPSTLEATKEVSTS